MLSRSFTTGLRIPHFLLVGLIWTCNILLAGLICSLIYYSAWAYLLIGLVRGLAYPDPPQDLVAFITRLFDCCLHRPGLVLTALFLVWHTIHLQRTWGLEERGGMASTILQRLPNWVILAKYFPIRLVASDELLAISATKPRPGHGERAVLLPNDRNYLVGCHPHGILATGSFINFATDATDFDSMFPGLSRHVVTLKFNLSVMLQREYLLGLGKNICRTFIASATD
ncbi:unnamed protein product [Protopolystoma xenopodis]|uniref:diacylglycerol O-acyltransferase n=1 Tax=Protopolystoma xenopodis TaxID=117903 RepID=A0A3S5AEK6_9PLAT|nr:unnamed protein product [Protopolystoma xenopodis]